MNIRLEHIKATNLNLLVYFAVLSEERNISRAAKRLALSQPSMSRALQQLRRMFADDLLLRGAKGYELTPMGNALQREMEEILPRIDRLVAGSAFDPEHEMAQFRICATDNATHLFSMVLCRDLPRWSKVSFEFKPWNDSVHEDLDHGRIDLLLNAQDGSLPKRLRSEVLYQDEVVCVVSKDHPLSKQVSFDQYLAASHIDVTVLSHSQSFLERDLAKRGATRRNVFCVPYFSVAMNAVAGTEFMTTVPRRLAESIINRATTKLLLLPKEISGFKYLMAWHPRMETDSQNSWLRQTMRDAARKIQRLP
jgi:DNA-binding transcriptional LysR family regulator